MPRIKAICFDMDGLLFNTEDLFDEVGAEMVELRGHKLDPDLVRRMMGQQAAVALQLFKDHYGLRETVEELRLETEAIFNRILPSRLALMRGARELLERLSQANLPLALTTSSGMASVDRIMSIVDLSSFFHFRLTAEDIENGKPHPEIYVTAAQQFEVEPEEMLVFEDSENGCRSGVAAGAIVVAVPSKHGDLHDFSGAAFVAKSLEDHRIGELT